MTHPESVVRPQDLGIGRLFGTVRDAAIATEVCDDGRGFDAGPAHAGVGPRNMNERAALSGKPETESGPGRYVRMHLRAPLRNVGEGGKG